MIIEDALLLEEMLENFISKSEYCKDCPHKHYDENRQYCYFGIKCIFDEVTKNE